MLLLVLSCDWTFCDEVKHNPTRIIAEFAYHAHIQTELSKYKTAVVDVVKQLALTDVVPVAIQSKPKKKD